MRLIGKSLENLTILSIFFWHKKPKITETQHLTLISVAEIVLVVARLVLRLTFLLLGNFARVTFLLSFF